MNKNLNILALATIGLAIIATSLYVGYSIGKNDHTALQPNPVSPTQTTLPAPTGSSGTQAKTFPGFNPAPTSLKDCLEKVNQRDAPAEVVEGFRAKCYEVFR